MREILSKTEKEALLWRWVMKIGMNHWHNHAHNKARFNSK